MIGVYERNGKLYVEVAPDSEAHQRGLAVGEHRLPSKRSICPQCIGVGVVGYKPTEADFNDPDFMADVGNGFYDVACTNCDGQGDVVELNQKSLDRNTVLRDYVKSQGGW